MDRRLRCVTHGREGREARASREARARLVEEIAENIKAFLEGEKRNRVV